ncbi:MAG TPA: hypothetical protein VGO56_13965 [Pyrinomonadaceae bacterium]|nr:hypothetical protein [Pyrinomonadaceae bacterium]
MKKLIEAKRALGQSLDERTEKQAEAEDEELENIRIRFAVNETPYCFWDLDVHGKNLEFVNKIDPKYFEHIADLHGELLEADQKQYAAAALRLAYSHGLETLFALLCPAVQAPDCVIGWFLKYRNSELLIRLELAVVQHRKDQKLPSMIF